MHIQEVYTREITPPPIMDNSNVQSHDSFPQSFVKLDQKAIEAALYRLQTNKSPGPDGLHPLMLKEWATELSYQVNTIFHSSFASGTHSIDWKKQPVHISNF